MKRPFRVFALLYLFIFVAGIAYAAEDYKKFEPLTKLTDEFYAGLADIIERNVDNPKVCLSEVESYYQVNKDKVAQIRSGMKDFFKEMYVLAEKTKSMSLEERKAFTKSEEAKLKEISEPLATSGGERYVKAMGEFSTKYPEYGLEVAAKAVQLFPIPDMTEGENSKPSR
ncbi:MAG: hypothetical protein PHE61_04985 [Candidatus Omnitrophica bacterium]|nr:hypothetical protein [Candidatus Omnitrophota bacterium]